MKGQQYALVLAFYPHARGFAYVLFEGPRSPVDWGMSDLPSREKPRGCLARLRLLLDRYTPDILVIREMRDHKGGKQKAKLSELMLELAESRDLPAVAISREHVKAAFGHLGSATRYAIAETIGQHLPIIAPYLPPARKIWNGEDRRMGLFDAAALALTFFHDQSAPTKR
jgi:hypothetical protein